MAYIYLDDLKKILPVILGQWIDEDDESWDWIFQEIEQKCHVGKKKKKSKKNVDIDALAKRLQDLNKEVEEMHRGFIIYNGESVCKTIGFINERHGC